MKFRLITTSVLMCVMIFASQAFARRVYVKLASDTEAWSHITADNDHVIMTLPEGSSDLTAHILPHLQQDDEVWIAKGEYILGGQLTLANDENAGAVYGGVKMYGGFSGKETDSNQRTYVDKDENGIVELWEFENETNIRGKGNSKEHASSFRLVKLGQGSLLDGVTLSDNYYTGSNAAAGGEIAKTTLIRNSIIRDVTTEHTGTINGGGLYVTGGAVENCLFETCRSLSPDPENSNDRSYGGGLMIYGAGDQDPETPTGYIKNSVIRNCQAGTGENNGRGAGLFGKGGVLVENCVIYNNSSTPSGNGGAIYFHNVGDQHTHVNRVINCTIANNFSMYPVFPECDFFEMYNTIVWGNSSVLFPPLDGSSYENTIRLRVTTAATTAYPFLDGIAHNGTIQNPASNKNSAFSPFFLGGAENDPAEDPEPEFINPTDFSGAAFSAVDLALIRKANWFLKDSSPMIGKGVNAITNRNDGYDKVTSLVAFEEEDILGTKRGESYDLGAYQYATTIPVPTPEPIPGGTNIQKDILTPYLIHAANGIVTISGLEEEATITIYDMQGSTLVSTTVNTPTTSIPLNNKGVYIVSVKTDSSIYNRKVVL